MGPAAILDIVVRANTTPATNALRNLNVQASATSKQLSAMDAIAAQQSRNLRALGTTAKYAAGGVAVLAGAGLYQVVKSGVEFNKTMESNRLAMRRFVGGTKETDKFLKRLYKTAKETPFEFTDLTSAARRLMAFGLEADKTERILGAVGDAIAAMGGGAENIDRVTLALGQMQAKGKVSAEELLQLTEAGIPAYKILKKELGLTSAQVANIGNEGIKAKDAIAALTRGMESEFAGAAKEQSKTFEGMTSTMKDNWAQMTGAMTSGLFEETKSWLPEINKTMEGITRVFQDADLSFGEKVDKSLEVMDKRLGPIVREVMDKLKKADIGSKLLEGLEWFLPRAAETMARGAGKTAVAFAKGFLEAGVWGKLFLAGWFIKALGGWGLISALGNKVGMRLGGGIAGGLKGGLIGVGIAASLAAVFTSGGVKDTIEGQGATWGRKLADAVGGSFGPALRASIKTNSLPALKALRDSYTAYADKVAEVDSEAAADMLHLADKSTQAMDRIREGTKQVRQDIYTLSNRWGASLSEIRQRTEQNMRAIRESMERGSMQSKIAVMDNFKAAVDAIKSSMDAGEISAKRGAQAIHQILIKQLKSYGISDPEGFLNRAESVKNNNTEGARGLQKGGMVPGAGVGDKVPLHIGGKLQAMVEPGEYVSVANKKATAALMDANQRVPRFASGGQLDFALGPETVPPIQYDANHAGGNSHWHITGTTTPWVVNIGKALQRMGFMVGEHPAFGGVQAQHSATGGHYDALAIDVNSAADETHAETVKVAALLGGKGGKAAGGFAGALKLALPRFSSTIGLGAMVAQGLNNSAAAIETVIGKLASAKVGAARGVTGGVNSSYSGPLDRVFPEHTLSNAAGHVRLSPKQVTMIANKAGLPGSTFEKIAHGESQYYPGVVGSDAEAGYGNTFGHGLWQITSGPGGQGPPWGDLIQSLGGRRQMFNPITNSEAAKHIYEAQGIGAWYGTQYLQKGGILKLAKGSGGGRSYTPPPTTYTPAPVRGGSYTAPPVPKKVMDMVNAHIGAIKVLDEELMLADHFASYFSSENGTELGPLERATQLFLNEQLLTNLEGMRDWINRGLGLKRTTKKGKEILQGLLTPLIGDSTGVGRILETKKTIDELRHPDTTDSDDNMAARAAILQEMLKEANLRTAVSQAQYRVLANTPYMGAFANGGVALVGERGPELAYLPSGTRIRSNEETQQMLTPTVVVNGDIVQAPGDTRPPIEVQGARAIVQQGSRGIARRPLTSARGY